MFSGIIEGKAKILEIQNGHFIVENTFKDTLMIGQSIAHDGACMSLEKWDVDKYSFFVMKESLSKTNFGEKKVGDFFNTERSLKVSERIDGHFVSGHIDTTGKVKEITQLEDTSILVKIEFPESFRKYLIEKGSISVNGVSLTAYNIEKVSFTVSLIPLTQRLTNLGVLKIDTSVNLEFDVIGKYILNKN